MVNVSAELAVERIERIGDRRVGDQVAGCRADQLAGHLRQWTDVVRSATAATTGCQDARAITSRGHWLEHRSGSGLATSGPLVEMAVFGTATLVSGGLIAAVPGDPVAVDQDGVLRLCSPTATDDEQSGRETGCSRYCGYS